jgi:hypothetical protein
MRFTTYILIILTLIVFRPVPAFCQSQVESADDQIRLANGTLVEGTFISATNSFLIIQTSKGDTKFVPWKYLSTGTRWRYERPMLAEQEARRIQAEKEAKARAEAAAKAAAAKAAAAEAAKKKPTTITNQPVSKTESSPAGVTSNKPAVSTAK